MFIYTYACIYATINNKTSSITKYRRRYGHGTARQLHSVDTSAKTQCNKYVIKNDSSINGMYPNNKIVTIGSRCETKNKGIKRIYVYLTSQDSRCIGGQFMHKPSLSNITN